MFDDDVCGGVGSVPAGLDEMPPGPVLGGFLASIDVDRVSGHDRVVVLRALARQAAHLEARVLAAMAAIADHIDAAEFPDDPELSWHAAATEIGTALRLTRRGADARLDLAVGLRRRLPRVWESLYCGSIDRPRAGVILRATTHLDEPTARRVVDQVIEDAPTLTTGQLGERLRRLCIETDPDAARRRYEQTVEQRRVVAEASPDGTAHLLGLDLPADQVTAITRRIDRLATDDRSPAVARTPGMGDSVGRTKGRDPSSASPGLDVTRAPVKRSPGFSGLELLPAPTPRSRVGSTPPPIDRPAAATGSRDSLSAPGTTRSRPLAHGASTPWYRT